MKVNKRCGHVGCRELIEVSESYCEAHKSVVDKEYNKWRNEEQTEYVAFYKSTAWNKTRKQALRRDQYLCQRCLKEEGIYTVATLVDHIIPTKVDWEKRLDLDNLQGMCDECHNIKTAEDKRNYNL